MSSRSALPPGTRRRHAPAEIATPDRHRVVAALTRYLSDGYLLMIKTHVAHWNAVGPRHLAVHQLTEAQVADMMLALDEVGERMRAIGEPPPDSEDGILSFASLKLGSTGASPSLMVEQLARDHRTMVRTAREAIRLAAEADDLVTGEILLRRLAFHEKAAAVLGAGEAA